MIWMTDRSERFLVTIDLCNIQSRIINRAIRLRDRNLRVSERTKRHGDCNKTGEYQARNVLTGANDIYKQTTAEEGNHHPGATALQLICKIPPACNKQCSWMRWQTLLQATQWSEMRTCLSLCRTRSWVPPLIEFVLAKRYSIDKPVVEVFNSTLFLMTKERCMSPIQHLR